MSELTSEQLDALKHKEQERAYLHTNHQLASKTFADQTGAERLDALKAVREYGLNTVKSLAVLNGGAILGLLTFTASFFTRNDRVLADVGVTFARAITEPFLYFGAGLVCSAIVSGIGYVNYSALVYTYYAPGDVYKWIIGREPEPPKAWHSKFTVATAWIAVITATGGLIAFVCGALKALNSLSVLGV